MQTLEWTDLSLCPGFAIYSLDDAGQFINLPKPLSLSLKWGSETLPCKGILVRIKCDTLGGKCLAHHSLCVSSTRNPKGYATYSLDK